MSSFHNADANDGLIASVDSVIQEKLNSTNVAKLGRVIKFYPETSTVDVEIISQKIATTSKEAIDYGSVTEVPLIASYGSGGGTQFPVSKNDTVLLLFHDRSIVEWKEKNSKTVNEIHSHDLHDALAIPFAYSPATKPFMSDSQTKVFYKENASESSMTLTKDTVSLINELQTKISLDDKVDIRNTVASLLDIILSITGQLKTNGDNIVDIATKLSTCTSTLPGTPISAAPSFITAIPQYTADAAQVSVIETQSKTLLK